MARAKGKPWYKNQVYVEVLDETEMEILRRYWAVKKREQRERKKFFEKYLQT